MAVASERLNEPAFATGMGWRRPNAIATGAILLLAIVFPLVWSNDYVIDVADDSAVMTYRWTIDYQLGDTRSRESGQELLVWVCRRGTWLIAWRTQRPQPAS